MFHRNARITVPCVFHTSSANRNPIEERPTKNAFRARALEPRELVFGCVASRRAAPGCVQLRYRVDKPRYRRRNHKLMLRHSLYTHIKRYWKKLVVQHFVLEWSSTKGRYRTDTLSLFQCIHYQMRRKYSPKHASLRRRQLCRHTPASTVWGYHSRFVFWGSVFDSSPNWWISSCFALRSTLQTNIWM